MKKYLVSGLLCLGASLSAGDVNIVMPKVPEVPKVPVLHVTRPDTADTVKTSVKQVQNDNKVHFSNHVAPSMQKHATASTSNKKILPGDIKNGRVSAYLHASYMSPEDVETKLEDAGFAVLRFTDDEVLTSIDAVAVEIEKRISARH